MRLGFYFLLICNHPVQIIKTINKLPIKLNMVEMQKIQNNSLSDLDSQSIYHVSCCMVCCAASCRSRLSMEYSKPSESSESTQRIVSIPSGKFHGMYATASMLIALDSMCLYWELYFLGIASKDALLFEMRLYWRAALIGEII